MTKKRTVMERFALLEISAVDRPAMEGALAVIAKRHDGEGEPFWKVPDTSRTNEPEKDEMTIKSFDTFEDAVAALRQADESLNQTDALSKARGDFPDLYQQYQSEPENAVAKAATEADAEAIRKGVVRRREIDQEVAGLMSREKVNRQTALRRLRRENPALFENEAA